MYSNYLEKFYTEKKFKKFTFCKKFFSVECQFVFVNLLISKLLQTTFFKLSFYKMINISYFDIYNNTYFDCSFSNHVNQELMLKMCCGEINDD